MEDRLGPSLAALVRRLRSRRLAALGFTALATLALALVGTRLSLDEDLLSFLPGDDPEIRGHARALRAFKALDTIRIDLGPLDSEDQLVAAVASFEATLLGEGAPLVSHVFAGVPDLRGAEIALAIADLPARSLPSLARPEEVAAILSKYDDDAALDERLASLFVTLNGLDSAGAQTVIRRDPLGLEGPWFGRVQELQAVVEGARLERGRIVSSDRKHALLLVEPRARASDIEEGEKVMTLLARARERAEGAAGSPLRMVVAGGHQGHIENARAIKFDAWFTSLVSLAAMFLVYAAIFPRRWLIPLTALPLVFGGVFGTAVCALLLGKMSKIAIGFGGILLGLADDFIVHLYYFYELRSRDEHPEPAVSAVERIALPTLAAGTSIAGSFVALAASGFPGQRDLAVFATASLAGTVGFCLLVHPLLLPSGKAPRPLPRAGAPLRAFVSFVERHTRAAVLLAVVATLVLGAFAARIRFEDDPRALDARSKKTLEGEDELSARWGDPSALALVVASGASLDEALAVNDRAYPRLEKLRDEGAVRAVSSIAPLVPSSTVQAARRAAWRALWTEERRASLAARLGRLGGRHHFSARAFEPFLERTASDGDPVSAESLATAALPELVGPRIARDGAGALVVTLVRLRGTDDDALSWVGAFERETGAAVTTGRGFARALVRLVKERLLSCGALAFVAVLAILVSTLRRWRLVLAATLPLALGLVWSVGLLALTGTRIDAVNFLIPVLTFGLSVDYVLFLASGYGRSSGASDEVEQAQGAVVASSVTTLAGMASLLLARHPAIFGVGVVSFVGTSASLLAIFVLTPLLLRDREP
ncbi:MAG TPA: MMPL family transporter [Planctomycetota bacterium]|nr:MMPL family transporter [Planctomycetota bacterium]